MPIYEYQCAACGRIVEKWQNLSEAPLTICPQCGGGLNKLISACAFHLKGSGWYVTDYAGKGQAADSSGNGKETPPTKEAKEGSGTPEAQAAKGSDQAAAASSNLPEQNAKAPRTGEKVSLG